MACQAVVTAICAVTTRLGVRRTGVGQTPVRLGFQTLRDYLSCVSASVAAAPQVSLPWFLEEQGLAVRGWLPSSFIVAASSKRPCDDRVAHRVRVPDVLERVAVEDDQVRELARLERADVLVHAQILGTRQRGRAERLVRRHAALLEDPHLPMRGEAFTLAVRAELHAHADVARSFSIRALLKCPPRRPAPSPAARARVEMRRGRTSTPLVR